MDYLLPNLTMTGHDFSHNNSGPGARATSRNFTRPIDDESDGNRGMMSDYVRIPMYILIFIVCVVGNSLVIVTLHQNRKMRTVTNIFLINLSVGDLLLGVFCMPFTLTGQLLESWIFGVAMCKVVPYFQVVSVAVSTFTLVSISIERLFAICWPLTSRRWQTVSHSIKMTILCWILACTVALPALIYSQLIVYYTDPIDGAKYYKCREEHPQVILSRLYNTFLLVILFGLPGIFMTMAYVMITWTLYKGMRGGLKISSPNSISTASNGSCTRFGMKFARRRSNSASAESGIRNGSTTASLMKHSVTADDMETMDPPTITPTALQNPQTPSPVHEVRNTHSERNLQAKKRVILMLITVVLEFFICFTPIWIVNVIMAFDPAHQGVGDHLGPIGLTYLQLLMYLSTCCNPITYCFMHANFRQGFIQAFRCKRTKPEISEFVRSQTTRPISYRRTESYITPSGNGCKKGTLVDLHYR